MTMHPVFQQLLTRPPEGLQKGITSVCSAHPLVLEAALLQARDDATPLLVEATCNQVNQFGGYTGMKPADFVGCVHDVATRLGDDGPPLIFGGDHLGPNPWRHLRAEEAMHHAETLVRAYAAAGFQKLHLDASMRCADDPAVLPDECIAERAARLCAAAEAEAPGMAVYVIGTEVPVPGGASEALEHVEVTAPEAAARTWSLHEQAFAHHQLQHAWPRVIAMVVQPGVEFDHTRVIDYQPAAAQALSALQRGQSRWVFEAHSTDYQQPDALQRLVHDGFAILKVGPALTFALREALYALELIEGELVARAHCSDLRQTVDECMRQDPTHWQSYYGGDAIEQARLRVFSYSDRVRYYWGQPRIASAVGRLLDNLSTVSIPENLLSQYLPRQYHAWRNGRLACEARSLLLDHIRDALRPYACACGLPA